MNIKIIIIKNQLYINEYQNYYNKESIYILNYNKNDIEVIYSIINNINNSEIIYPCCFNKNSNYILPIFNTSNNKLIGVKNNNYKYYNKGLLFGFLIEEFISELINTKIENKNLNEINILIKVNENDINNEIYFINNNDEILDELNQINTQLYINNIKKEYKKYFIPEKEGEYNIRLKFDITLTDCSYMFANCINLNKINFICFNTKYVNTMKYMFHKCKNLEYINNLFLFDTRNVTDISNIFSYCYNLNNLDLSSFNIKNVKKMNHLFDYCYNLKNLKLFYFNNNKIIDIIDVCNKIKTLKTFPYNIKNNKHFEKYPNEIDILIKIKKDDINKKIYFLDDFVEHNWLSEVHHRDFDFKELNSKNTKLYINDIKKEYKKYFIPVKVGEYNIKLKFNINLTDCSYMFANCKNIIQINFIHFNTSYIINMSYMFCGCANLINLDLSSFDTKNVIDMNRMFTWCYDLNNLDVSSFDTRNVNNMSDMFSGCSNLNNLDVSSFDTRKVTNMNHMFFDCGNLKNLDLSSFDTTNVTNMNHMFAGCSNLINLDLSSFDTTNVTDMSDIFLSCSDTIYESNKNKFNKI